MKARGNFGMSYTSHWNFAEDFTNTNIKGRGRIFKSQLFYVFFARNLPNTGTHQPSDNPWRHVSQFLHVPNPSHSITLETAKTLPAETFKACFNLVQECKDMYKRTIGWLATVKKREMKHPAMRYLILSAAGSGGKTVAVVGFLSFMITEEDELGGWRADSGGSYELHLAQEVQGRGLGRILVEVMEGFGKRVGVEKVMLTVFLENEGARRFYSRLGYVRDDFTPDDVLHTPELGACQC
ncbi:hypothetical protein C7212DRAFT_345892 [Tuber magnatum]|uniref:N-alpha-acetyltransferase 40 n=1 Tax=Tuber magnatum TaxID=42249 RepID=A0A317SJF2_9PEZI|nr:hypothetical protein C7212DRAFT_345892 [Tuber magnatum]